MQPVLLSAYTMTSCLGHGLEATRGALAVGESRLAPCAFETVALDTFTGEIPSLDATRLPPGLERFDCRNNRAAEAGISRDDFVPRVEDAARRLGRNRIGVFIGTSTAGILQTELAYRRRGAGGALPAEFDYRHTHNTFSVAEYTRARLGLAGPCAAISTACSSSAKAFASAQRLMEAGLIDAAVVGGVDTLCLTTLYGFNSLQLLSRQPCRPYDAQRDGMRSALESARLAPDAIDYVNLHGTGTPSNDAAEDRAVLALFGERVPVNSTKGMTGHALGAAGAAEAIVSVLALEEQRIPASPGTRNLDAQLRARYEVEGGPRPLARVLSNSFGFGGSNCSLVFGRLRDAA